MGRVLLSVLLPVFGNVTKNRHIQSCFLQSDHLPSHKMGRKTATNKCDGFSGMLQLVIFLLYRVEQGTIHPYRTGDSVGIAGLKRHELTSDESCQYYLDTVTLS